MSALSELLDFITLHHGINDKAKLAKLVIAKFITVDIINGT